MLENANCSSQILRIPQTANDTQAPYIEEETDLHPKCGSLCTSVSKQIKRRKATVIDLKDICNEDSTVLKNKVAKSKVPEVTMLQELSSMSVSSSIKPVGCNLFLSLSSKPQCENTPKICLLKKHPAPSFMIAQTGNLKEDRQVALKDSSSNKSFSSAQSLHTQGSLLQIYGTRSTERESEVLEFTKDSTKLDTLIILKNLSSHSSSSLSLKGPHLTAVSLGQEVSEGQDNEPENGPSHEGTFQTVTSETGSVSIFELQNDLELATTANKLHIVEEVPICEKESKTCTCSSTEGETQEYGENSESLPMRRNSNCSVSPKHIMESPPLKRLSGINPAREEHFQKLEKSRVGQAKDWELFEAGRSSKLLLDKMIKSSDRERSNTSNMISKMWGSTMISLKDLTSKSKQDHSLSESESDLKNHSGSLFWETVMRQKTFQRRFHRKRRWGKVSVERIEQKIRQVNKVNDKKSYYSVFCHSTGRTLPLRGLLFSLLWTMIFLCFHKNYFDWGTKFLGMPFDPWFSYSFFDYFGVALGYLLYMQAEASSTRWWEGRVQWQSIMENSKRLTVLINTHHACLRSSKYGTRLVLGLAICVRNLLQNKYDPVWEEEMLEVLDELTVERIMKQPRRLRYLAVCYSLQRIVEVAIESGIMPREVVRDINPTILSIGQSMGACNRIRMTKLPYIISIHLQFMYFVFIVFLPMSLVGVEKYSEWGFALSEMGWRDIYWYTIIIGYAYVGLCKIALDVDDPFSFTREHHSFGFWGFYEYWSAIELENLRSIFRFRAARYEKHGKSLVNGNGNYGDGWASNALEAPVRKILNADLPITHNLHGLKDKIARWLDINKHGTSFWDKFNHMRASDEEESSSFTFTSASDNDDSINHQRISVSCTRGSARDRGFRELGRFSLRKSKVIKRNRYSLLL